MLTSYEFCGNGWSGRSETKSGAHMGEEANSAPLFLPGSSQPLTRCSLQQEVAQGCWSYSGHIQHPRTLLEEGHRRELCWKSSQR